MSVVDQLKKIFAKKQPDSELESRLSLAMPDGAMDIPTHESTQAIEEAVESPSVVAPLATGTVDNASEVDESDLIFIPVLGKRTVAQHQRKMFGLLGASLLLLGGVTFYALNQSDKVAQQLGATGQSLMQSQRLAKSVTQAVVGSAQAFPDVAESSEILSKSTRGLLSGDDEMRLNPLDENYAAELAKVTPLVDRAEKNAKAVMSQQKMLTQIGSALRLINRQSSDLLEIAETVSSLKLQQNAPAVEISAVGQLVMLTQRIGKSSNEFLTAEGVSPEAVFLLGKDLNTFKEISEALLSGSTELRLTGASN